MNIKDPVRRKVKLEDIALKCGVSISSASRALNNEPGISSDTRRKVLRAAEELNFSLPKRRRPLTRKVLNLMLVVPEEKELSVNPFLNISELMNSINDAFTDEKKRVEVVSIEDFGGCIMDFLPAVDGVLFAYRGAGDEYRKLLRDRGVPYIFISRIYEMENYVSCNYFKGTGRLAKLLLDTGHSRIGYLGNAENPNNEDRFRAYCSALYEHALLSEALPVLMASSVFDVGPESAEFFIRNNTDAVICFNDYMAIRLITELERAGKKIPEDISITGFDNSPLRNIFGIKIDTIAQPAYEMGFLASRWLRDNILNRNTRPLRIEVDGSLLRGESVVDRHKKQGGKNGQA